MAQSPLALNHLVLPSWRLAFWASALPHGVAGGSKKRLDSYLAQTAPDLATLTLGPAPEPGSKVNSRPHLASGLGLLICFNAGGMLVFKPTADERGLLKTAVSKYSHDPIKSSLLSHLDSENAEYSHGTAEWNDLKAAVAKHLLHVQTELHRNPNHKPTKLLLVKVDALSRQFIPNFS